MARRRERITAAALPLLLWAAMAAPAAAQAPAFEYSVRVLCGRLALPSTPGRTPEYPRVPVFPGKYYTSVTVRNPGAAPVTVTRTVAVALPGRGGAVAKPVGVALAGGAALETDCGAILQQAGSSGDDLVAGFVVIQSSRELDVIAVYTAAPLVGAATGFQVERVPARRLP